MTSEVVIGVLLIGTCISAPLDDPVHIDLPVYDRPQTIVEYPVDQISTENYPGGDVVNNNPAGGSNLLSYKLQAASSLFGGSKSNDGGGLFSDPISTRETVLEETEGYGSKTLSVKENIQGFFAGMFQPEPIVDTISENDKYGNTGDKFYSTGRAIVGGAEGISNFINSAIQVPGKLFQSFTRKATEKLNNLGGKLIGL